MVRCSNCMKIFDEAYGVCPNCGYILGMPPKEAYHLYPGTVLKDRYVVGTTVGFGGFGITYRAWDQVLDKQVAIKEFYPNGIVNRVPGEKGVIIYSGNRANEFENGKIRFLAEARNMARFNMHPNIVNVYEFFEENHTAYIAMEFLDGMSYKQYLAEHGGHVEPDMAIKIILSVLVALKEIHKAKIIHRDISPDNIFLVPMGDETEDYRVKLIDFGAARFASGEEEKELSIILKPGYAPPEQYRSKSRQGPWTDIYAAGAVLYRSITGQMPDESVNRMVEDHLIPPIKLVPELPQYLNDSILRAMALNQELRFQNVDQFREGIENKAKVLSVGEELKKRKLARGLSMAAICAILIGAAFVCNRVYVRKQAALYNVQAAISMQMPDLNGQKISEVEMAGILGSENGEAKGLKLDSSADMIDKMLQEYEKSFQKVTVSVRECSKVRGYQNILERSLIGGEIPSVFESSEISTQDTQLWEKLGTLDITYDTLNQDDYYFISDEAFQKFFAVEKKQIPLSFRAPVLYVNTYLVPEAEIPGGITSLRQLEYEGKPSFCVSNADFLMYQSAFEDAARSEVFQKGKPASGEGYEPFLKRETAYYLGSTDDYEAIRASLGGIYKMVVLQDLQKAGKVKGHFTHLWSIDGSLEGEAKKAADNLVYYLMGETAQDIFNLQNGNGLSMNRAMMNTYVKGNDEFQEVVNGLSSLEMEYGEENET